MSEEYLHYLVSDYFATGEGRCISMMITPVEYTDDDYEINPTWTTDPDNGWTYNEGKLNEGITETVVLTRKFVKEFDSWYGRGLEILSREEFLKRYPNVIPEAVKDLTDPSKGRIPAFYWKQQVYFNFS